MPEWGQDDRHGVVIQPDAILPARDGGRSSLASPRRLLLNPKFFRNGIVMLVLVVGTAALLFTWISQSSTKEPIGYSQFLSDVAAGNVQHVTQQGQTLSVDMKTATDYTVNVPNI